MPGNRGRLRSMRLLPFAAAVLMLKCQGGAASPGASALVTISRMKVLSSVLACGNGLVPAARMAEGSAATWYRRMGSHCGGLAPRPGPGVPAVQDGVQLMQTTIKAVLGV